MVGVVMGIFLLVFLVVDATCCYRNCCGLLMSIAVKLFGQKVPGLKMLEEGDGTNNGRVKLKSITIPREGQTNTKEKHNSSPPVDAKMGIITSKQYVLVGEDIFLLCKAGGEGEITWQKNGEDIDDEDKVTSKLLIKNDTLQDVGRYTCLCEFENGHSDDVQIQLYIFEGPSFGRTITYHEFPEGSDGVAPCLVHGQPVVDVRWFKDKQEILSNGRASTQGKVLIYNCNGTPDFHYLCICLLLSLTSGGERVHWLPNNTLRIGKVKRDDAGTMYVCQAQIRGRPIYQQLPISVVIIAPPKVHLREDVKKKVLAGSQTNISLLCLVDGLPKANIQ
uniref:LOW QUALITY PROTEIN: titin-like n=1 Tax=Monopterus albus TaxID=43700 RepID=UPI0009B4CC24|nr:LOW QUALITY PROTEIN: titin-like [Monopterus albus]